MPDRASIAVFLTSAAVVGALGACAPAAKPGGAPMDGSPGGRAVSLTGATEAIVADGGELSVAVNGGSPVIVDSGVDRRLAIAADDRFIVYAKLGFAGETDLWYVDLRTLTNDHSSWLTVFSDPKNGEGAAARPTPVQLTNWVGSEDRPAIAPDGRSIAFVSSATGLASWYRAALADPPVALALADATQLTNTSLGPRHVGAPPTGYTPPPDTTDYRWDNAGLSWTSRGQKYAVVNPLSSPLTSPGNLEVP